MSITKIFIAVHFIALSSCLDFKQFKSRYSGLSFYSSMLGEDRTLETRLAYRGTFVLEITLPVWAEQGPFTREITNGRHFLQMIYSQNGVMSRCDETQNQDVAMTEFLSRFFKQDVSTLESISGDIMSRVRKDSTSYNEMNGDLTAEQSETLDFKQQARRCRELHKLMERQLGPVIPYQGITKNHKRTKRSTSRSMDMIYPGTKWCGNGNVSSSFEDLGEARSTDKCCREHDHCPVTIEAFQEKWQLLNYRFSTVSHCVCDEKFRHCLKTSDTSVSDLMGKMFFDIMETPCFILEKRKICLSRTWWGRCEKYGEQYVAVLHDAMRYH